MSDQEQKPVRWITAREVLQRTGMSRTALYERRLNDPGFPKPIKLGRGVGRHATLRWVESELEEWMQGMMDKRD